MTHPPHSADEAENAETGASQTKPTKTRNGAASLAPVLQPSQCSVDGCHGPVNRRGLCRKHYERWRKAIKPVGGVWPTPHGARLSYIYEVALNFVGNECLFWPFGTASQTYPTIRINGKRWPIHRLICFEINGEPPSPTHLSTHSCGKGDKGCINPRHLRWGTPKENAADKLTHGTAQRGELAGSSKLKLESVLEIRATQGVVSPSELAETFGVSPQTIKDIRNRKSWAWLDELPAMESMKHDLEAVVDAAIAGERV